MFKSIEASNLLVSPKHSQEQIVDIPELKEENYPVVCRVPRESNKGSYHMYDIFDIMLIYNIHINNS